MELSSRPVGRHDRTAEQGFLCSCNGRVGRSARKGSQSLQKGIAKPLHGLARLARLQGRGREPRNAPEGLGRLIQAQGDDLPAIRKTAESECRSYKQVKQGAVTPPSLMAEIRAGTAVLQCWISTLTSRDTAPKAEGARSPFADISSLNNGKCAQPCSPGHPASNFSRTGIDRHAQNPALLQLASTASQVSIAPEFYRARLFRDARVGPRIFGPASIVPVGSA